MRFKDALIKKNFVVTSEVQTPSNLDNTKNLINDLRRVRGRLDGVSIVDSSYEGIVSDSVKTCELLNDNRFDAIYQTTTRNKNRFQLQKDFFSAFDAGVENLLVFTEDYRITGETPQEDMFFHVDSGKLSSVLDHLKEGCTFDGRKLDNSINFVVGAGVESGRNKNISKHGMYEMETMKNMGTGYFLTTPVFDLEEFNKFNNQAGTFGVPIIAEVVILENASVARFINRHFKASLVPEWVVEKLENAPIKRQASIELFGDTVSGLKEICNGVHIITFGGIEDIKPYLDIARLL